MEAPLDLAGLYFQPHECGNPKERIFNKLFTHKQIGNETGPASIQMMIQANEISPSEENALHRLADPCRAQECLQCNITNQNSII